MRIRYARWYAGSLTGAGLVLGGFGVAGAVDRSQVAIPVLGAALILTIFGLLTFGAVPYAEVSEWEVRVPLTRGPYKRTAVHQGERVATDGDRLLLERAGGEVKRLPVYRAMAHPDDWAEVVRMLSAR